MSPPPPPRSPTPLPAPRPENAPFGPVFGQSAAFRAEEPPTEPAAPQALVVGQGGALDTPRPVSYAPGDVFRRFLMNRGEHTREAYARDFQLFADWLGVEGPEQAAGVLLASGAPNANALALEWLDSMRDQYGKQLAPSTRARRLSTLKSFVRAARLLGAVPWAIEVEGPRVNPYLDTAGPSEKEVHNFFTVCGEGLEGLRNRAIMALFASRGLRRKEVGEARREDYDGGRFFVHGKGGKDEWVTLPAQAVSSLDAWIWAWEKEHGPLKGGGLFRSLSKPSFGQDLSPKGIYWIVREIGRRAGVDDLHPHALRHSAITAGLDATGGNVRAAQRFARHSDPKTTGRYDDNRTDMGGEVARLVADKLIPKE